MSPIAVEIAQAYVSLIPSAKGFGAAVAKELGGVGDIGGNAGAEASKGFTSKFTSGLGGIAAAVGGAFAAVKVGGFLKDAISGASDLSESVNKIGVVFDTSAKDIIDWSKTAATSLGQSQQQALEAAGTFGNLFRAMGITTDVAATMSKKTVELASDLASFNNANPADVLVALKSGLVGETEPLRAFGVNLNEARIKAEALRLGLVKSTVDQAKFSTAQESAEKAQRKVAEALKKNGEGSTQYADAVRDAEQANAALEGVLAGKLPQTLDAATKAQAAYSLILADTTLAQGDFKNTSPGLANQLRILAAQWKDLKDQLGTPLLKVVTGVVTQFTTRLIPTVSRLADVAAPAFDRVVSGARLMFAAFTGKGADVAAGPFAVAIVSLATKARNAFDEIVGGVRAFVAAFRSGADDVTSNGFAGVLERIGIEARNVVDVVRAVFPTVRSVVSSALEFAGKAVGFFVDHFEQIVSVAKLILPPILAAVVAFRAFGKVQAAVKSVQALLAAFKAFRLLLLASPWGLAVAGVAAIGVAFFLAYKRSKTFHDAVQPAVQAVIAVAKRLADYITGTVVPALIEFGQWLGPKLLAAGQAVGRFITGTILPALATAARFIRDTVIPALVEFGQWLGPKLLTAAKAVGGFITGTVIPALSRVGDFVLHTVVPALIEFAQWLGPKLVTGGKAVARFVTGVIIPAFRAVGEFLIDTVVPALVSFAEWLGPKLVAGGKAVAGFVTGVFVPALQAIGGFITGTVIPALASLIGWFSDKVLPVIVNVAGLVKDVLVVAFRVVSDIITGVVVPVLQALWTVFSGVILPILKEVAGFIVDVVIAAFQAWWAVISNVVLPIFDALWHTFTDLILPILKDVAQFIAETALVAFDNIVTLLRDKVIPAFSEMWSYLNDKVIPIFATVVGAVATFVTGVFDKISGLVGDVKTKLAEFVGFFTGLGQQVSDALGGVLDTVFGLGVDIVQGIIDGIKSMATTLATEVGKFIDENVPGPVKKVLGIASPSKVMYGYGVNTAQGLTDGILAGQPALVDAATSLGESVADATTKAVAPIPAMLERIWTAPDGAKLRLISDAAKKAADAARAGSDLVPGAVMQAPRGFAVAALASPPQGLQPGPVVQAPRGFAVAANPSAPLTSLAQKGATDTTDTRRPTAVVNVDKLITQETPRAIFDELAWHAATGTI